MSLFVGLDHELGGLRSCSEELVTRQDGESYFDADTLSSPFPDPSRLLGV